MPLISASAFDSIALSARAKPWLTCCASPQKTIVESHSAIDACPEGSTPAAGGTISGPAALHWSPASSPMSLDLVRRRARRARSFRTLTLAAGRFIEGGAQAFCEFHGIVIGPEMLDEQPRLFFMHFWANDDAVKLAKGLRAALDKTASSKS